MKGSIASSGKKFFLTISVGTLLAVFLVASDAGFEKTQSDLEKMRSFQQMVGGLGIGASATPAWTMIDFDPRLQPIDDSNLWPIPGAYPYSPSAVSTAVSFKELPREDLRIIRIEP